MLNTKHHIETAAERGMWLKQRTKQTIAIALGMILFICGSVQAARYMEKLGRGVVAVYRGSGQVYVGWRMLGTDPETIAFNVYRNETKIDSVPILILLKFRYHHWKWEDIALINLNVETFGDKEIRFLEIVGHDNAKLGVVGLPVKKFKFDKLLDVLQEYGCHIGDSEEEV